MAKLSVRRHADRDAAEAHYLDAVDRTTPSIPPLITARRDAKWQEAQEWGGPILSAEAQALGCSIQSVIDSVTAARREWCESEAAQEAARIRAKSRIRNAGTPAEMHRAYTDYQAAIERLFSCLEER
ncbi:hypothetical protein QWY79_10145 [Halomonas sabkhae]|uniref:hypothetical protein n=1 Tax=Halomonas sabkhae TaxID=626223 RepID=UPI0025B301A3|nr:hypothetical protein [Halomonas sabkhae]MDN3525624.1 hypothetical protein [Halomonas sabkhae]